MRRFKYDSEKHPFSDIIEDVLGVDCLHRLHYDTRVLLDAPLTRATDQSTEFHKLFYSRIADLLPLYHSFLEDRIAHNIDGGGRLVYQKTPNIRIHFPGNVAVGEWHRDRDYGHQPRALNVWLPLTPTNEQNTVWVESQRQSPKAYPLLLTPGEYAIFSGVDLKHGNKINESGQTRVSLDFRVMREEDYDPHWPGKSINTGTPHLIGGYYERLPQ
jgi:hypothetical protein